MSRRGFTLLEVLVATVIMGVAVTGLIVGLSQSVHNASRLAAYDRAVMLGRTQMNELLLDANLPFNGEVDGSFDSTTGWSAKLSPFEVPPNAGPGTVVLQQIRLEIWWRQPNAGRSAMQLAGYRPARIPAPPTP